MGCVYAPGLKGGPPGASSPSVRPPSIRPSVHVVGVSHFWLRTTLKPLNVIQRNLTGNKISTSSSAKFVFFGSIGKQDVRPGLWLAKTFSTSSLQPLKRIQRNLTGSLVGCGLMSHSAIFQLYSDGTVVQFPNFDLLPGTKHHGPLGVFSVPSLPRHGHRDVRRRL